LDAWSEMYVGAQWLVTQELPNCQFKALPRHGALSQMVLFSSHHLVEVIFFQSVKTLIVNYPGFFSGIEKQFDKTPFRIAFQNWPAVLVGSAFNTNSSAIISALKLADRRNATIHKESALATPDMARSALYSSVHASREIAEHLLGKKGFKYEKIIQKYPLPAADWFHETKLVNYPQAT
jgi:hypothetical protein